MKTDMEKDDILSCMSKLVPWHEAVEMFRRSHTVNRFTEHANTLTHTGTDTDVYGVACIVWVVPKNLWRQYFDKGLVLFRSTTVERTSSLVLVQTWCKEKKYKG